MQKGCQENTSMPIKKTMCFCNETRVRHLNPKVFKEEIADDDEATASS